MRRWIAGAAAFYLDILYNHYADIWNSQRMARVSKIAMFTFYSAQLFVYGQVLPLSVCARVVWRARGWKIRGCGVAPHGILDRVSLFGPG